MREVKITFLSILSCSSLHFISNLLVGFDFFEKKKNTKKAFHGDGLVKELSKEAKEGKEG